MCQIKTILKKIASRKKVLIIGATIVDNNIAMNEYFCRGGDIYCTDNKITIGGCAFNVADVISKLKLNFDFFTPIGTGPYSELIIKELNNRKFPYNKYNTPLDNGYCLNLVEPDGERTFITIPGIETCINIDMLTLYPIEYYDYIYISGYELEGNNGYVFMDYLSKKSPNTKLIIDLGPRLKYIEKNILKSILTMNTILTVNESEIKTLAETQDLENAIYKVAQITQAPIVVSRGEKGALIYDNMFYHVPSVKTKVIDTSGAGDSHTGGIIAGLISDLPIYDSVFLANEIASNVVAQFGAATAPTLEYLESKYS